jgi:hypothetical protein
MEYTFLSSRGTRDDPVGLPLAPLACPYRLCQLSSLRARGAHALSPGGAGTTLLGAAAATLGIVISMNSRGFLAAS